MGKPDKDKGAEKFKIVLDKLFEELGRLPPGEARTPVVNKILYLVFGGVRSYNEENPDHPHWEAGDK